MTAIIVLHFEIEINPCDDDFNAVNFKVDRLW